MKSLKYLTVLVFTKDRYIFLNRCLKFLCQYDQYIKIIVADSSKITIKNVINALYPKVKVFSYDENIQMFEKIKLTLNYVKTPCVFLCGDDDFPMIYSLILYSIRLYITKDFNCTIGKNISFTLDDNKFNWYYLNNFYERFYCLYKTTYLKDIFKNYVPHVINANNEIYITDNNKKNCRYINNVLVIRQNHKENESTKENKNMKGGRFHYLSVFLRYINFPVHAIYKYHLGTEFYYINMIEKFIKNLKK
jgi:hypothetical protein